MGDHHPPGWKTKETILWNHRCTLCGMPGFPSEFTRTKTGKLSSQCKACQNRMAAYREEAKREGRVLAPLEKRHWWKPNKKQVVEQQLCRQYIDTDISEEEWDTICNEIAGPIDGTDYKMVAKGKDRCG